MKLKIVFFLFFIPSFVFAASECERCIDTKCCFDSHSCSPKIKCENHAGTYLRLSGGVSIMPALDAGLKEGTDVIQNRTVFDNGFDGDIAIGYRFLSNFRLELALGYLDNAIVRNENKETEAQNAMYSGSATAYTGFVNGYYNFNFHSKLEPYVGGGIGYIDAKYQWQFNDGSPANTYTAYPSNVGYQAIGGLNYFINKHVSLSLDYRYLYSQTNTFNVSSEGSSGSGKYQMNFVSNLVNVGIAYRF